MWYIYIIELSDGSYYTGITTDLSRRLGEHIVGKGSKYVESRLPIKNVVYVEEALDRSAATKREIAIKKMTRKEKECLVKKQ